MRTLALPTLPVKQARTIAYGLALACTTLAPLPSPAFTYDTQAGPVVAQHQSTGTPLVWHETPIAMQLALGDAGHRLLNSTTSWNDNAASAMAAWNAIVAIFVQQSTAVNMVRWARPDEPLGSEAGQTRKEVGSIQDSFGIVHATVLLNPDLCWDAYDGPLRVGWCNGTQAIIYDVRRVVLHELGHVLGLEHPDDGGQVVSAIMNHSVSDLDALTPDDEAGLHFLYPAGAPAPSVAPQAVTQAHQGAGGGGGGCAMGTGDSPDLFLCVLVPLVVVVETLRHAVRG